jgi:tetratricopeptide (TPR) repeat protein
MQQEPDEHEDAELDRLVRFLTRPGPRFGLALAIYRDPVVARELRDRIEEQITAGFVLRTLSLDYEDRNEDLVARMGDASRGAHGLFVSGLDSLLIDGAGRADPSPAILTLNGRRDELPERLEARVVLWMSKAGHKSFRENAWDLHEVMQTVCEFERSAILPLPASAALELPEWFRSVDPEHALAIKSRAEALARATEASSDLRTRADAASSTARAYLEGTWLDGGMAWLEQAATAYEQIGDFERAAIERLRFAEVLELRGELELAYREAARARDLAAKVGDERGQGLAMSKIADIRRAGGELDEAIAVLRDQVLPIFERLLDAPRQAATLNKLADALQAAGRREEALHLLEQRVLPLYERLGDVREQAATLARVAGILEVTGDLEEALRLLRDRALPLYERISAVGDKAVLLGRIADILEARREHGRARRIRTHDQLSTFERVGAARERDFVLHKLAKPEAPPTGEQALAEELARVVHDRDTALVVLTRLGFPRGRIPPFRNPSTFWLKVIEDVRNGAIAAGEQALIETMSAMYPGNASFARLRTKP